MANEAGGWGCGGWAGVGGGWGGVRVGGWGGVGVGVGWGFDGGGVIDGVETDCQREERRARWSERFTIKTLATTGPLYMSERRKGRREDRSGRWLVVSR